jgi:hypothetical protein
LISPLFPAIHHHKSPVWMSLISTLAWHPVIASRGAPNMTLDDFRQSLTAAEPHAELTLALAGLWWDAKGDWTQAHESAQQDEGPEGC